MRRLGEGEATVFYSHVPSLADPTDIPIFFFHGVGLTADAWVPWFEFFPPQFSLLSVELRGHGAAVDYWSEDYSIDTFTGDFEKIMNAEGYRECHFVGESFGGTVGLALAARLAERVRTVTVLSTAFDGSRIATLDEWPDLVASGEWPRWMARRRLGSVGSDRAMRWVEGLNAQASPDAVLGIAKLLQHTDLTDDLKDVTCPVFILAPSRSPFVGTDLAKDLHRTLALNSEPEIAFVPDAAHGIVLSHARVCAELTMEFITRRGSTELDES